MAGQEINDLWNQSLGLDLITKVIVDPWISDAAYWDSIRGWEILALKPLCGKSWSSVFIRWRLKRLFSCIDQATSDEIWGLIKDWIYQIDMLLLKTNRHYVGARHIFSKIEPQAFCWQPKNWGAWSYTIIKSYERRFVVAIQEHATPLISLIFISIPKKMIVLISSNRWGHPVIKCYRIPFIGHIKAHLSFLFHEIRCWHVVFNTWFEPWLGMYRVHTTY